MIYNLPLLMICGLQQKHRQKSTDQKPGLLFSVKQAQV